MSRAPVLTGVLLSLGCASTAPVPASAPLPESAALPRHFLGVQAGGTGFFQAGYRYRLAHPLLLDTGAFMSPGGGNASLGVVIEAYESRRFIGYGGLGGGAAFAAGTVTEDGCDPQRSTCKEVAASGGRAFVYERLGGAVKLGAAGSHRVACDVGAWFGMNQESRDSKITQNERFAWPMIGVSYFYAFAP
jgi:hypothetical protein